MNAIATLTLDASDLSYLRRTLLDKGDRISRTLNKGGLDPAERAAWEQELEATERLISKLSFARRTI